MAADITSAARVPTILMSAFTGSLPDGILAAYIVSPSAIVPTGLMHLA